MNGEESDEKKQDKDYQSIYDYFYLQLIRIPKNNECNLIRLCQKAYNIGQLNAVFLLDENKHIYTEMAKNYFFTNNLNNINAYTNFNLDCYKRDYSKLIKSIRSLLNDIISHSKYLKYKSKYLKSKNI